MGSSQLVENSRQWIMSNVFGLSPGNGWNEGVMVVGNGLGGMVCFGRVGGTA